MEIKKFEQEIVEKTPIVKKPKKTIVESNTEKITKFDEYAPVNEAIEELTLEEKVENLEHRLRNIESRIG